MVETSDRIKGIPIIGPSLRESWCIFRILKENEGLIAFVKKILQPLLQVPHIHKQVCTDFLDAGDRFQVIDKLAKYRVLGLLLENGCAIDRLEPSNEKDDRKADIKCVKDGKPIFVEVKHIRETNLEKEAQERAFREGESSWDIPFKQGMEIPIPSSDRSIEAFTTHSCEIEVFYNKLLEASDQLPSNQSTIVAFVLSSFIFHEKELEIAFCAFRHKSKNRTKISVVLMLNFSDVIALIRNPMVKIDRGFESVLASIEPISKRSLF
jgi:hypothetical protein